MRIHLPLDGGFSISSLYDLISPPIYIISYYSILKNKYFNSLQEYRWMESLNDFIMIMMRFLISFCKFSFSDCFYLFLLIIYYISLQIRKIPLFIKYPQIWTLGSFIGNEWERHSGWCYSSINITKCNRTSNWRWIRLLLP